MEQINFKNMWLHVEYHAQAGFDLEERHYYLSTENHISDSHDAEEFDSIDELAREIHDSFRRQKTALASMKASDQDASYEVKTDEGNPVISYRYNTEGFSTLGPLHHDEMTQLYKTLMQYHKANP